MRCIALVLALAPPTNALWGGSFGGGKPLRVP